MHVVALAGNISQRMLRGPADGGDNEHPKKAKPWGPLAHIGEIKVVQDSHDSQEEPSQNPKRNHELLKYSWFVDDTNEDKIGEDIDNTENDLEVRRGTRLKILFRFQRASQVALTSTVPTNKNKSQVDGKLQNDIFKTGLQSKKAQSI